MVRLEYIIVEALKWGVFRWGDNDGNSRNAYSFVELIRLPNLSENRGESRAEQIRTEGEQTRLGAERGGGMFGISNLFATRRDSRRLWWVGVPRLISVRQGGAVCCRLRCRCSPQHSRPLSAALLPQSASPHQ